MVPGLVNMLPSHGIQGGFIMGDGWQPVNAIPQGVPLQRSVPIDHKYIVQRQAEAALKRFETGGLERLQSGNLTDMSDYGNMQAEFLRAITTTQTGFPVRENLEAPTRVLVPLQTPVRNMLPRVPGQGIATSWRQTISLGGGWGTNYDQPGGNVVAQFFFGQSNAPATIDSVYAAPSLPYKLMGTIGGVTGLAIAGGANYQNQYETEKTNAIKNLMLLEEYALMMGSASSTALPWGNGSTAYGFDGLINLISTANGVPSAQIQTSVGAWTIEHIETQLSALYNQGGVEPYIIANRVEKLSLSDLIQNSSTVIRATVSQDEVGSVTAGMNVTKLMSATSGEDVPVYTSRFQLPGTVFYGCKFNPDGSAAMDVDVLPQIQLPELAPNQMIQGYTAQEIAPAITSPQVFNFLVSVYEVPRMKNANVFASDSGVTAV